MPIYNEYPKSNYFANPPIISETRRYAALQKKFNVSQALSRTDMFIHLQYSGVMARFLRAA